MGARRLLCSVFVVMMGALVFASAPALAIETPETGFASAVTAHTATLEGGVLNPNKPGETNEFEYEYMYKASASECQGGSVAPVPEGHGVGLEREAVPPVKLTGLEGDQAYTFCLVERFTQDPGEVSPVSAPVTFTTLEAEPSIESESVSYVEASAATLNAQINPNAPATTYYFQYGTSDSYGQSTPETALPENGTATIRIPAVGMPALKPATTYHYRVVAINSLSPAGGTLGPDRTFTTPAALGSEPAQNCTNEQRRSEQPYALELPDCRAYEMVSPLNTEGQDATDSFAESARAAVSGEAIIYSSKGGTFADPAGSASQNQFISRRGPEGWSTRSGTLPQETNAAEANSTSFGVNDLTPELTVGVAETNASLTSEAPAPNQEPYHEYLYVDDFTDGSYRYVSEGTEPMGSSTDLTHIVFDHKGGVAEWVNGDTVPVSVSNKGENISAGVGGIAPYSSYYWERDLWHAVSADGSRVYFSSPQAEPEGVSQLFVRVNAEQPQSPLASQEANATGTLTEDSGVVSSIAPIDAAGEVAILTAGSTEVVPSPGYQEGGPFFVGQPVSGEGIPAGDTVAKVSGKVFTLSVPAETSGSEVRVHSYRPYSFAVGQHISGYGIPPGTTVTGTDVAGGTLTLSHPANASGSATALHAGGECTDPADACTIEVSASQRTAPDPVGLQPALYRGASADGSRVFFTSKAELTEDAYTGPAGNAANLYEYDLERPEGERLKNLTVDKTDTDGAGVLGVVQISEDGSYVYFVASGDLATGATAGQPNLYVTHDNGVPVFIAKLAANDVGDWHSGGAENEGGPEQNTAVVTPTGDRLAFLSENSLTGYDNEQAEPGECEGKIGGVFRAETGRCQEVYLYDAETDGLVCASCNPTGARPVGPSSFTTKNIQPQDLYRSRNLIEDGALFFDSSDALVPHTSDGRRNVYEYKNGHVYPISDVAGDYESFFLDASANGDNVFFGTADQLLPQDVSNNVVVYDARVGGGFPVTVAPPPCDNGDSCKPPEAPQPAVFGTPGSATFSGPGNVAPAVAAKPVVKAKAKSAKCKKGYERKNGKCVKKRKAKKKAKKSSERKGSK